MTTAAIEPTTPATALAEKQAFQMQRPMIAVVDEMFRTRRLVYRDGSTGPLDVFIPREQGDLLYSLVRYIRPTTTIEVGLANGISALFIAQALRDNGGGQHIAIDPFQVTDWAAAGIVALERAGLEDLVSLDPRASHCALPDLEAHHVRAQFVFVDGSHQFDYVVADFLGADRILDVGGLIAFDDADWPAVTAVIRFVLANRRYTVFDPGVVIEPAPVRPRLAARMLRALGRRIPPLGRRLHPAFLHPNHELGIRGRCVVLEKLADDQRDSQSRSFVQF